MGLPRRAFRIECDRSCNKPKIINSSGEYSRRPSPITMKAFLTVSIIAGILGLILVITREPVPEDRPAGKSQPDQVELTNATLVMHEADMSYPVSDRDFPSYYRRHVAAVRRWEI